MRYTDHQRQQPPTAFTTPAQPAKKRHWIPTVIAAVFLIGVVVLCAIGLTALNAPTNPAPARPAVTPTFTAVNPGNPGDRITASAPPANATRRLTAGDVKLTVQLTQKDCFGSAGCNVSYRVRASWPTASVKQGESYEVIYAVSGVEDGPQIGTLTLNDDGTETSNTEDAQTTTTNVKLTAKVQSVEKAQ